MKRESEGELARVRTGATWRTARDGARWCGRRAEGGAGGRGAGWRRCRREPGPARLQREVRHVQVGVADEHGQLLEDGADVGGAQLGGVVEHDRVERAERRLAQRAAGLAQKRAELGDDGLQADVYFGWARSAETAMMPSVAMLCEEIAHQKRHRYVPGKCSAAAMQAREDVAMGKMDHETARAFEIHDVEAEAKTTAAERAHLTSLLIFKVFIGNVPQRRERLT